MFNLIVGVIISSLVLHWIGDFVLQNDWMAVNKSKQIYPLFNHCLVYSLVMTLLFVPFVHDIINLMCICCVFFITHVLIDYLTSKLNSWLWQREMRHWFFVSIGFDQILHYLVIIFIIIEMIKFK